MQAKNAFYACLVLALSVLLVFTACRGQQDKSALTQESETVTENSDAAEEQTTEADRVTTAVQMTEAAEPPTVAETETAAETTPLSAPTDTAQIVQLYNDAVNRAVDSKASFTKTRWTDAENLEYSPMLAALKQKATDFMGIDQQSQTQITPQEDYSRYLQHASLTLPDVDSAECTVDADGNYQIELHIKDGKSHASEDSITCTAPLNKCGIAVGERDKDYWDHKTAENVYTPIAGSGMAKNIVVDERYDSAVVKAVVRPDGTPVRVEVRFHIAFDVTAVFVGKQYIKADGNTAVTFDRFSFPDA